MPSKSFNSGVIDFAIGTVFMRGAISKAVSNDPIVPAFQWFCALMFFVLGALRLTRHSAG